MPETVSDTACEIVVVTTPGGEQVLVRRWAASGRFDVDWRAVADPREVWRPVAGCDWFAEFIG